MTAHSGTLTIDLAALRENYLKLKNIVGASCETAAVVKANAYGLGVQQMTPALWQAGARAFFVALLEEGIELRKTLPEARIAVLNGLIRGAEKEYAASNLIPVINTLTEIKAYQALAKELGKKLPAFLHIDTGMNRLGLEDHEIKEILQNPQATEGINILCIMSHFTSSEERESDSCARQYEAFSAVSMNFPGIPRSFCNSSGIFRDSTYHMDLVRPGMALYGLNPTPDQKNPMHPVIKLEAPVMQIRTAQKGDTCGYNETYRFNEEARLAVVSIGYADGLLRSLSNTGSLFWKGHALPIRGRISMDLTICDLSGVPENIGPLPGDHLEIIGPHQSADMVACAAKTIGYEILTSLGSRYARLYKNERTQEKKPA
ncbi:MAG: alanine racemase [Alphaproteobacteria bacterium]|nr:alanine racemase [Alphaproteobacteria bacterium]